MEFTKLCHFTATKTAILNVDFGKFQTYNSAEIKIQLLKAFKSISRKKTEWHEKFKFTLVMACGLNLRESSRNVISREITKITGISRKHG